MKTDKKNLLARHETGNGRIKQFHCKKDIFRHVLYFYPDFFHVVINLTQVMIESGEPLYSVDIWCENKIKNQFEFFYSSSVIFQKLLKHAVEKLKMIFTAAPGKTLCTFSAKEGNLVQRQPLRTFNLSATALTTNSKSQKT